MDTAAGRNLPEPVSPHGPLQLLGLRVHEMMNVGRFADALVAADAYEAVAVAGGDEKTVAFIWQCRMYTLQMLGLHDQALVVGHRLVHRRMATGWPIEAAKTLADLAWSLVV